MTYNDAMFQLVTAQMQGHPVLGTEYVGIIGTRLISNATKVADALVAVGVIDAKVTK